MENFYTFLSFRGIKRIPRSLSKTTTRATTVVSNIRNENEVQVQSNSESNIIEDSEEPCLESDYFYSKNYQSADKNYEYVQVGNPTIPNSYAPSCLEFSIPFDFHTFEFHLENNDVSRLITNQPAEQFNNSLKLKHLGITKLLEIDESRMYKNNLSTIVSSYLIVAVISDILIYEFDPLTHLPKNVILRFDTKPLYTSSTDRLVSTFPYFPHTINYIQSGYFLGKEILCACADDGTLLIWYTDEILDNQKPRFKLKFEASLWGVDFKDNFIVGSDNSQTIVLLYFHQQDERFYHVKSHHLQHNIPDVSIIEINEEKVLVSCVSISGEIVTFEFKFFMVLGPLNGKDYEYFKSESYYYIDSTMEQLENRNNTSLEELLHLKSNKFKRITFSSPIVISRCVVNEDCWTVKSMEKNWFLEVGSYSSVFGSNLNEEEELNRIQQESEILNQPSKWQFHESKTVNLEKKITNFTRLTSIDDEYRRIRKELDYHCNKVLLVSTASRIAMLNFPSLYCCSSTKSVLDISIPCNEDSRFSRRMSISYLIPELSCFIACSQQGFLTIMRLCCYKGVYGMRQEYLFPNAMSLALGYHGYRTIIGLSVRVRTITEPKYLLYIIYNDGLVLTYELRQ